MRRGQGRGRTSIAECHPLGLVGSHLGGLDILPEILCVHVPPCLGGVDRPAALARSPEELHGLAQNRALRGDTLVAPATPKHDQGAEAQHDGGQGEGKPEADILFSNRC